MADTRIWEFYPRSCSFVECFAVDSPIVRTHHFADSNDWTFWVHVTHLAQQLLNCIATGNEQFPSLFKI